MILPAEFVNDSPVARKFVNSPSSNYFNDLKQDKNDEETFLLQFKTMKWMNEWMNANLSFE